MPGRAANGSLDSSTKYPGGESAVAGPADAAVTAATSTVRIAINRIARLMGASPRSTTRRAYHPSIRPPADVGSYREQDRERGGTPMIRVLLVLAAASVLVGTALAATNQAFPARIDLPDGFQPEGIATAGQQFYVGSIPTGDVYRGSLRTGQGSLFVDAPAGRQAIGMKVDRGRLFVAGGPTG